MRVVSKLTLPTGRIMVRSFDARAQNGRPRSYYDTFEVNVVSTIQSKVERQAHCIYVLLMI